MSLKETDEFLVQRGATPYKVDTQNLMTKVQDDDLLIVSRETQNYKITGLELKESFGSVSESPTSVTNVSLIEADPEGDRFTSQSFVASSQVVDGNPTSVKTFDAHVDGTLSKTVKFDEPLESSSTGIVYSDNVQPYGGNWQEPPAGAFQGISPATQSSYTGNTAWIENLPNTQIIVNFFNKVVPANGYVDVWTWSGSDISVDFQDPSGTALGGVNSRTETAQGNNNVKVFRYTAIAADQLMSAIVVSRSVGGAFMSAIDWNGTFLSDQGTALTFANGTDMEALAAGDTVNQTTNFNEPLESSGSSVVSYNSRITSSNNFVSTLPPENAFDGDNTTYCASNAGGRLTFDATGLGYKDCRVRIFMNSAQGQQSVTDSTGATWTYKALPGVGNPYDPVMGFYGFEANITGDVGTIVSQGIGGNNGYIGWIQFDDEAPLENGFEPTLTFAADADMKALASGDTVNQINNFTEPLESSTTESTGPITYSNFLTASASWVPTGNPANAFGQGDGFDATGTGSYAQTNEGDITFNCSTFPLSGEIVWASYGSNRTFEITHSGGTEEIVSPGVQEGNNNYKHIFNFADVTKITMVKTDFYCVCRGIKVNSTVLLDGGSLSSTNLTFANGTDMSALAAGDGVSQPSGGGTQPDYQTAGDWIYTAGSGSGNWGTLISETAAFDGAINSSPSGTGASGNCPLTKTFSPAISGSTLVIKYPFTLASTYSYSINGGSDIPFTPSSAGTSVTIPGGALRFIKITQVVRNSYESPIWASLLEVDGMPLVSGASIPAPTGTVGSITGTTATLSSSSGDWTDGEDVTTGDKTTTGTVGSITDTTAALSSSSGTWVDGVDVTTGDKIAATGTVAGVSDTTATLSSSTGAWANGFDVTGPQKTIVDQNARLYCAFDSNGNVTDLQNKPQDPPYTTTASNPGLTLTFPATFPSGQTPDEELPEGTTLTVEVTATNSTSTDSKEATVQPEPAGPDAPLAGLTTLYTGNGTGLAITNGIDLAGEGGLVWIKQRSTESPVGNHYLYDTTRGAQNTLSSNTTDASYTRSGSVTSFSSSGFSVGNDTIINGSGRNLASWTFRKAPKFFDVVTYTGNGSTQNILHSLGSVPGMIVVKATSAAGDWFVYHSSIGADKTSKLNTNAPFFEFTSPPTFPWNNTTPTSTEFSVAYNGSFSANTSGVTYVAYLFAEDTPGVIKCGSYTGDDLASHHIDCGFDPQWVMIKNSSRSGNPNTNWVICDSKRPGQILLANANDAEGGSPAVTLDVGSNGFTVYGPTIATNVKPDNYIYVAIAAPPPARSQTNEEFVESTAKFLTYDNRKQVKEGEEALSDRKELEEELIKKGLSKDQITKLFND